MMWLSVLPIGRFAGMWPLIASVCRKRRPPALSASWRLSGIPSAIGPSAWPTMSSRNRLAWRALRAISEMPVLWWSSSSRIMIGRNTSCSSNRNRLVGSCISTLVSRTKSLVGLDPALGRRAGTDLREASAAAAGPACCSDCFNKVGNLLGATGTLTPSHSRRTRPHCLANPEVKASLSRGLRKKRHEFLQQFGGRFFGNVMAAVQRSSLHIFRPLRPIGEGVETAFDRSVFSPEDQERSGDLAIDVGLVVRKVDRFGRAVVLAARVDRRRVAKAAPVLHERLGCEGFEARVAGADKI